MSDRCPQAAGQLMNHKEEGMSVRKEHSALPSEYLELTEGFLETKRSELGPEVRAYPD